MLCAQHMFTFLCSVQVLVKCSLSCAQYVCPLLGSRCIECSTMHSVQHVQCIPYRGTLLAMLCAQHMFTFLCSVQVLVKCALSCARYVCALWSKVTNAFHIERTLSVTLCAWYTFLCSVHVLVKCAFSCAQYTRVHSWVQSGECSTIHSVQCGQCIPYRVHSVSVVCTVHVHSLVQCSSALYKLHALQYMCALWGSKGIT